MDSVYFHGCSTNDITDLGMLIKDLGNQFCQAHSECLEENKPDASIAEDAALKLLDLVHGALFSLCSVLFVPDASDDLVKQWLARELDRYHKVNALMEYMCQAAGFFHHVSDKFAKCTCIVGIVQWLIQSQECTVGSWSQRECTALLASLSQLTTQAAQHASTDELCRMVETLGRSPYFSREGRLMSQLLLAQSCEMETLIEPIVKGFQVFQDFPKTPIKSLKVDVHEAVLCKLHVEDKVYGRVLQKALDMGDSVLHKQVSYLHAMQTVAKALLAATVHTRRCFHRTSKYADWKISAEHVNVLRHLRKANKQFQDCHLQYGNCSAVLNSSQCHAQHFAGLDGSFDAGFIHKSVVEEAKRIEGMVAEKWMADLDTLTKGIISMCPDWYGQKETLLSNEDLCQELISNRHYKKIGGMAGEITASTKLLKSLYKDGAGRLEGLDAEATKSAKDVSSFGILIQK